jgi:hypothetical protein
MGIIPDTKDSDGLLAKEKGLRVLDLEFMMLPLTVNCIILEHVGLRTQTQSPNEKKPINQYTKTETRISLTSHLLYN